MTKMTFWGNALSLFLSKTLMRMVLSKGNKVHLPSSRQGAYCSIHELTGEVTGETVIGDTSGAQGKLNIITGISF